MFGSIFFAVFIMSHQLETETPLPSPYTCVCIYNVGCGSFHPKRVACPCTGEQ